MNDTSGAFYVSAHAVKGTFEMAMGNPDRYQSVNCYLVGPIAVHRCGREWKLSVVSVGMATPGFGRTLREAVMVARALASAIDWSTIKRGKSPGSPRGWTKSKRQAASAMLKSFRFIDERHRKARIA